MQRGPAIHTSLRRHRWVDTREGSNRRIGESYDSRIVAVTAGRLLANQDRVEHVSHRADGFIDEITDGG